MAGTYIPTKTVFTNGVIDIQSTAGLTYDQILNSMGTSIYSVTDIYLEANSLQQVLRPLYFVQYDVNGTRSRFSQINAVDPYQFQNAIRIIPAKEVYLNGRTSLSTVLLPNEIVFLILSVKEISNGDFLKPDKFFVEDIFKNYTNEI